MPAAAKRNAGILCVRIDPKLKAALAQLAEKRGCFETRIVEEALREHLEANEGKTWR